MATETIPTTYDPLRVEQRWYQTWLQRGYFHAPVDPQRRPFVIMMPLPNITGDLHIGHALNNTLQDVLIRWRRMQGRNAMWMPGTGHAGEDPLRPGAGGLPRVHLALEGEVRRDHLRPVEADGGLLRLGPRHLHHGSRLLQRGHRGVPPPVSAGVHLLRQADDQLVPARPDQRLRPGGGLRAGPEHPLPRALPRRRRERGGR